MEWFEWVVNNNIFSCYMCNVKKSSFFVIDVKSPISKPPIPFFVSNRKVEKLIYHQ